MSFVRQLIALPRRRPRLVALPALALLWLGWLLWPPQPDFRYVGPPGFLARILPNGRQLVLHENLPGYRVSGPKQVISVDVPSRPATIVPPEVATLGSPVSPDGNRVVATSALGARELRTWPSAELVRVLPKGSASINWSPSGAFLVLSDRKQVEVLRAGKGETIGVLPGYLSGPIFMPDGSSMCVVSPDPSRIETWSLDPFRMTESFDLPYSAVDPVAVSSDVPMGETCQLRNLAVSDGGGTIAAAIVRHSRSKTGHRANDCVVVWDRRSRRRTKFDVHEHPYAVGYQLTLSFDGGMICATRLPRCLESVWKDGKLIDTTIPWVAIWAITGEKVLRCETPSNAGHAHAIGHTIICQSYDHVLLFDCRKHEVTAKVPGNHVDKYWSPHSARGYLVVESQDESSWFLTWLRNRCPSLLPETTGGTSIVRLEDGSVSRFLPRRQRAKFCTNGEVWTCTSGVAESELIERWSPEAPRPWWLYMVTAAGAGYLIWPIVRPRSRRGQWTGFVDSSGLQVP